MDSQDLDEFPDSFLKVSGAYIYGKPGEWAVIIGLEPFELDGEKVKTQINLDAFPWPVKHPRELAGTVHTYSADAWEQGIEGAICLRHAHHPVDVTQIAFGAANGDSMDVTIEMNFDFSVEGGGFKNRSARIACPLTISKPGKGVRSYRVIE